MSEQLTKPLAYLLAHVADRTNTRKDASKPYVGLEHIPSGGSLLATVGTAHDSTSTNSVFARGDVLFGKLRPRLRKSVRAKLAGYCSTDILVLRPTENVDPDFAGFVAQSDTVFSAAIRTEEGTKMPRCSWKDLRNVRVFCPENKKAQARIASVLLAVNSAIEKTEALIEKHQQIKAGLMHDLFTRGVLPDGQLRPLREQAPELYQATPLGWLPREWNVAKTGDLCSFITKGTTPARDDMWQGQEGIRFLRVDNLTFDGQFDFIASSYRISARTHTTSLSRSRCVAGDVLMNIVGPPLGKVAHVTQSVGEVNINQAIAVFRPKAELSTPFLMRWLTSDGAKRWIGQRAKQTSGQLNVTLAMCQDLLIPHMSIDEQQLIGRRIQCDEGLLQSELARLAKMRAQKLGLMQDLLTGKVPVKVPATREPA